MSEGFQLNRPDLDPPVGRGGRRGLWVLAILVIAGAFAYQAYQRSRGGSFRPTLPWHHDAERAGADAAARGLPVLWVFTQPGCVPCARLKSQVLGTAAFESVARGRVVLAELDVRADKVNLGMFLRYGGDGTPFVVLTGPTGLLIAPYQGFGELADWLERHLAEQPTPTTRPGEEAAASGPA